MKNLIGIAILVALATSADVAGATTWRVEIDGSGDIWSIYAAVQHAADGDTILIGAGRWDHMFEAYGIYTNTYWDTAKELYLIGAGADSTIIGPAEYVDRELGTFGLYYGGTSPQHIAGIGFENVDVGMHLKGQSAWITDCRTEGCKDGFRIEGATAGEVIDCEFALDHWEGTPYGVYLRYSENVLVERCDFLDMAFYSHGSPFTTVRGCTFDIVQQNGAAHFVFGGGGVFEHNEIRGGGVSMTGDAALQVADCIFYESELTEYNLEVYGREAQVEIYRNRFGGGTFCAIGLSNWASISGSDNHILNPLNEYAVYLIYYTYPYPYSANIDLRNNYWGTDDSDTIAAMIYDHEDDHTILQNVQFEPYSPVPLDTKKESMDGFKAMFR